MNCMVNIKENFKFDLGVKGLTPRIDRHPISPNNIIGQVKYEGGENKGNDCQQKKFSILTQNLLVSTICVFFISSISTSTTF